MKNLDLRKTRASTVVDTVDDGSISFDSEDKFSFLSNLTIDPKYIITIGLKLALCGVGTYILMYYEQQELSKFNKQKAIEVSKVKNIQVKISKIKLQFTEFQAVEKIVDTYYEKLQILKNIVGSRLLSIKILDNIQNSIPKEILLNKINFMNNTLIIRGETPTHQYVSVFVEALEDTRLFSSVDLERIDKKNKGNNIYNTNLFVIKSILK